MTSSLTKALDEALQDLGTAAVLISRLASPELRVALALWNPGEVLAVQGRAVWPHGMEATTVAEWPGWLGQGDRPPPTPSICVSSPGSRPDWLCDLLVVKRSTGEIEVGPDWNPEPGMAATYVQLTSTTKRLVAHLTQAHNVTAAWAVRSPRALVLLPVDPVPLLVACPPPPGLIGDPVAGYPEFPGGLRLEMADDVDRFALRSWSTEFTAAITSGERET